MNSLSIRLGCVAIVACLAAAAQAGPILHTDFEVGQVGGQLVVEGNISEVIQLTPGSGAFAGLFVADEPGWESVAADEPPDIFRLAPGHNVALQRISFDSGLEMYESAGATQILAFDGDVHAFPQAPPGEFHDDLIYAGAGPIGTLYSATYRLVDLNSVHSASDPFKLNFEVVPEPTTLALLGVAAYGARRRWFR